MIHRKFLTKDEELALARKAKRGDVDARNRIVENLIPMVNRVALKIARKMNLDADDLLNTGIAHMCRMWKGFDPSRGFRASTYFLRGCETIMWQAAQQRLIHTPVGGSKARGGKADEERAHAMMSLDQPIGSDVGEPRDMARDLPDRRPGTRDLAETREEVAALRRAIEKLEPRTKSILNERMRGKSLERIGQENGISKERVRQIEEKGIKELRRTLGAL